MIGITAKQMREIAEEAEERVYRNKLADLIDHIKREANGGSMNVDVPFFNLRDEDKEDLHNNGFRVTMGLRNRLLVSWAKENKHEG